MPASKSGWLSRGVEVADAFYLFFVVKCCSHHCVGGSGVMPASKSGWLARGAEVADAFYLFLMFTCCPRHCVGGSVLES